MATPLDRDNFQENRTRSRILIADDSSANRTVLAELVARLGHEYLTVEDGVECLEKVGSYHPDVIFLDMIMPRMDGFETLQRLLEEPETRHIPVIIVSGMLEQENIIRCLELGADDYLTKPFNSQILKARLESSLRKKRLWDMEHVYQRSIEDYNQTLESRVAEQVQELTAAQTATIFALSRLAESRDSDTGRHLERICEYCHILARALREDGDCQIIDDAYITRLIVSSPLHDIGKVGIPDAILKKPGKLDADEYEIMKSHCTIGAETLKAVYEKHPSNALLRIGIEIAESHHEWWDGSGYPLGRKGDEIPLSGRILALADVYDALTSKRCYKDAYDHTISREIILSRRGTQFDPRVVDAFIERESEFTKVWETLGDQ